MTQKAASFEPAALGEAEFVLLAPEVSAAVAHRPGRPPYVVAAAPGRRADELLWCAQEMGLPLLQAEGLAPSQVAALSSPGELPEGLYGVMADCLALLHRDPASPVALRMVRVPARPPAALQRRLEARAEEVAERLAVPALEVRIGEAVSTRPLHSALEGARQRLEVELGLILPSVRLEVDPALRPRAWELRVRGVPAGEGDLAPEAGHRPLLDVLSREAHRRAWLLLGYRETEALLQGVRRTHPALVEELFPAAMRLPALRAVLRNLLREGLSIRDLPAILEAVLEGLSRARDPEEITEYVRSTFAYYLCQKHSDPEGALWALLLAPEAESAVRKGIRRGDSEDRRGLRHGSALWLDVDLESSIRMLGSISTGLEKAVARGVPAVLLAAPGLRPFLRRLVEPSFPDLPVLSFSEVVPLTEVRTLFLVGLQ